MKRNLCALLIISSLAACGPKVSNTASAVANAPAPAAVNAPAPTAKAEGADPFVGTWREAGDEGPDKGELKITAAGDGYQVSLGVGAPGCGGQVDGAAKRQGDVLHLLGKLPDDNDICAIDITRHPDGHLTIEEQSEECRGFHGAQCDFAGTAVRKTSAAKTPGN